MLQQLTQTSLIKWQQTSHTFTPKKETVSFEEKRHNEIAIDAFRLKLSETVKQMPKRFANRKKWQKKILGHVRELEATVSPSSFQLDYFLEFGYGKVTTDFIQQVRDFDSSMDVYDTFQAIRNVWIMNSMQILFEMEVKLTPSIFAYSMMYPYSDNYLDDPSISLAEKRAFNQRFKRWLMGIEDKPINETETKLYRLVKLIEQDYDRADYPDVFTSLLSIHEAQEKSLLQQMNTSTNDVLAVSVEKGGASVLADAYLVRGVLTETEAQFMFDYGVLLQLIDDLQDIEEDAAVRHQTLFTQCDADTRLDEVTSTLINFIQNFNQQDTRFISQQGIKLKEVICNSALRMLEEAIAQNQHRFSPSYISNLEKNSPVHFIYLATLRESFLDTIPSADLMKIIKVWTG